MTAAADPLSVDRTPIEGLLVVHLPVHGDNRGWFKENWQRAKMTALGLPDFGPVQNNVSFNAGVGTTRGYHAEPWDKYLSVVVGRIFGSWVDLREGPGFGSRFDLEIGPQTAVFVPRGVGNAFQALDPDTAYSYLVNDHWSEQARSEYTYLNLADETLATPWPVPLAQAEISAADRTHPRLADVTPFRRRRRLVVGSTGQLGRALQQVMPDADFIDRPDIDLTDPATLDALPWREYDTLVNAAAYTAVDRAETPDGRRDAWAINVTGLGHLLRRAQEHRLTVVHVSSDYVFDGTAPVHGEDEPFAPLGVYGQTKAAGDALVLDHPRSYVVRASWVVGDGPNFVRTMASLADRGISPTVVSDQYGRLTFAEDLARGIAHLLQTEAPYGVYNLTCDGPTQTWADIAAQVFLARGRSAQDVSRCSTAEYAAEHPGMAARPEHSTLDLTKITATGFTPRDGDQALAAYLAGLA